ncbi:response regulator transcription factor [Bacillus sp. MUM 13]|uniref:response regulator transcription factor n=1 Tax=Bacillus sp. MUM 13 TaxID=1678001 RepID=UPI0008F5731B|nr:response regulator transcription factor [Bacillus sp. MUM 13]OIK14646.1 hypothetical protein BIV59_02520 [Bacillus sp. MUM 13]
MAEQELCRTLIVDDEILIRQGIKHYINWEQEGFIICGEASNGQEALELIGSADPHIIITDIVMPIMDGEELTRIVKEKYPHIEVIVLSSFGEFDYVRSTLQNGAVDYILKPKLDAAELLKVLNKALDKIPALKFRNGTADWHFSMEQIADKLLSGYEIKDEKELQAISDAFPYRSFYLMGIDLTLHPSGDHPETRSRIIEKLETECKRLLNQIVSFPINHGNKKVCAMILNTGSDQASEVFAAVSQLLNSEPGIGLAVTDEFTDFSRLGHIYKGEFTKLVNAGFYLPEAPLLTIRSLPELSGQIDSFNLDWFTGECKRRNFDAAFQYLEKHTEALCARYDMDIYEFKAFFGNIIFNISIQLGNMDYDVKDLETVRNEYFRAIEEARTARDTSALLSRFIAEAKSIILSRQQPDHLTIKSIMEYIAEHYAEQLTLKDVANHFHFNPSYLSSYFSSHNNEGFIEYLNKIRIEEAAGLLITGTVSISEISGMVGYSDHSYFCKVFKKVKGMSPSQFRRKQIKSK